MADFDEAVWRKSSRSSAQGNCFEIADGQSAGVGVRDSKNVAGPVLVFSAQSWRNFLCEFKEKDHG
ncbi:DUF397 domain-containing protein [Micromonospora sp. WMMD714]|uniref:DUF397 domain-containing protein n=1 Tax=Micromonospora sp. WMMD714 TaxID=3016097 RepID=UPI00249BE520|nr:DUF397 domain-containing protein [Micromonospora sp. WMMD714]WFE64406.1 DUF397 domain-containing protein [Micromonospora sp. WMMD714]